MNLLQPEVTVTKKSECRGLLVDLLSKRLNIDIREPRRTKISGAKRFSCARLASLYQTSRLHAGDLTLRTPRLCLFPQVLQLNNH